MPDEMNCAVCGGGLALRHIGMTGEQIALHGKHAPVLETESLGDVTYRVECRRSTEGDEDWRGVPLPTTFEDRGTAELRKLGFDMTPFVHHEKFEWQTRIVKVTKEVVA